ncbi:MAG: GNAT family N-acetyltransferase [Clostridia bacterium]|nr:GNAT family N-acetyltransferase [Clostridia bacterium]
MRYISGMPVNGIALRTPNEGDAQAMIDMMLGCYAETEFLSSTPEEFRVTVEDELRFMQRFEASERECMISAFADGKLIGNVSVRQVSGAKRMRHRANIGISVLKDYWGRGVGSMLMDAAIQTAESAGYAQIELEVAADNERAIRLYERFGFREYGRCPRALKRENGYADEIGMVKILK